MKWTIWHRANGAESRSRTPSHAIWVAVLLYYLALTTIWAGPNVVAWGVNWYGQTNVPANLTNAAAVAAGGNHSLALRADGTVVVWGAETHVTNDWSSYGPATVPDDLGNVVAVATAENRSLALRADGTVVAWGVYGGGQTSVPAGLTNAVAVAAGSHSLVLRSDGTVVAWEGTDNSGKHSPVTVHVGLSNVVAVAAGDNHSLALRADGTVVAWGANYDGQRNVPANLTSVVAVAAGRNHSLALRADGTVVAWGGNDYGQTNVPTWLTNVAAVAGGDDHSLALRADGTVVAWGGNDYGQTNVPSGLRNVVAIAGGSYHSLAVVGGGAPFLTTPLIDRHIFIGGTAYFRAAASGAPPLRYQWQFNGTNLPGATNGVLVLADVQPAQAGAYSVVVSNTVGRVSSSTAHLEAVPILLNAQPQSEVVALGETVNLSVEARASTPVAYQWRLNGTDLPEATNSMLTLANLRLDQAGEYSVVVSNAWGTVTSWEANLHVVVVKGWNAYTGEEIYVPADLTNIVQVVATGFDFGMLSLALRADGTVVAWATLLDGTPFGAVLPPGLTNVVDLAAGVGHSLALQADGTVTSWDSFSGDPLDVPPDLTGVVAVAAGAHGRHSLALRADGTVVTWDSQDFVAPEVPAGLTNVVAIAGGTDHSLALRVDGTVAAWGAYWDGTTNVPVTVPPGLTNVVAVAGGHQHSLALRTDGTVVAWGFYWDGATNVPMTVPPGLTNVVAVAAGWNRNLALRADGTVVAWGSGSATNVPSGLTNVVAVSDGCVHSLALLGGGPPVIKASLSHPAWTAEGFSVSLPTQSGRVYALEYTDSLDDATWTSLPLVAGTGRERTLTDSTVSGAQRFYRVRRW